MPTSPMTIGRRDLILGVGAVGLASAVPAPLLAASFPGKAAVQAIVDRWVAEKKLPGAVIAYGVGTAPPEYVKAGTIAFNSAVKADENTLWRLASLTKPLAGMATVLLIAEGKLKLDQSVADFIPAFSRMRVANGASAATAAKAPITVRHLLTHTSGIGSLAEAAAGGAAAPRSLTDYVDRLAAQPLGAEPGTKYIYASGLEVASRVIEVASGMPFDLFLQRRLFAPIGMGSTYFQVPARDAKRLATLYKQQDGALVPVDPAATSKLLAPPPFPRASGGLVSTAKDYDRFLTMIAGGGVIDGKRVMPAEAVRLAVSNLLPPGADMSGFQPMGPKQGFGAAGSVSLSGPRAGTYGWGGASGTTAFVNPRLKTRISTFTNIGLSGFGREVSSAVESAGA